MRVRRSEWKKSTLPFWSYGSGGRGHARDPGRERDFPIDELVLLASERSVGKRLQFHGKSVRVALLDDF
ncbi:MAG: hypothetical protein CM1200mP9_03160 [Gammaproteobacteria bacterium]|nr:MAG: hypothetical protein CM1200mP9_03160 [Gammaproteobacteria bacterium]